MKRILLPFLLISNLLWSCNSDPAPKIQFCVQPKQKGCTGNQNQFKFGGNIYVSLKADKPFGTSMIVGTIYRLDEDKKIPLSSKTFQLEPGETSIVQIIPFLEFGHQALGTFSFEFENEQREVIATRELIITE